MTDNNLHAALVGLGVSMGVRRHAGQSGTEAAHEFADKALRVIEILRGDIADKGDQELFEEARSLIAEINERESDDTELSWRPWAIARRHDFRGG